MPKRKRATSPQETLQAPISNAAQKKRCIQRITAAQKPLLAALRIGAGLERQKHSRRKKDAQKKNDAKALERLETEYSVLKTIDLEKVGEQHLRKTFGKVKSLKEAEALQEYINGGASGEEKGYEGRSLAKDPATLNVTARLYKVPAVKKVVDEVIKDMKEIVGATAPTNSTQEVNGKNKKTKAELESAEDELVADDGEIGDDMFDTFSARIAAPSSGEEDSEASISDDERPPSVGDSESEHDPEDDLAAESESEADSFAGFSDDEMNDSDNAIDRNIEIVSSEDDSDASDSESATVPSNKAKKAEATSTTSSAFLPALSHAAYFSGSESEASDIEADIAPRKNRRGQRARQKIAEAKYGAKAKHLDKVQRNKGWDAKKGAVSDDRKGRGARNGAPKGRGPQQSGGNAEPLGQKKGPGAKRDDKGDLHPSWQAAKAAKESKKLKIDVKSSQGKKVVFD